MHEQERLVFQRWAQMPNFQTKVEQANQVIKEAIALSDSYVACSWGKDSLVLAHLVWLQNPKIPIFHIGSQHQDKLDNYSEVEENFIDRFPCQYFRVDLGLKNAKSTFAEIKGTLPLLAFIGLRAEESAHRKKTLSLNKLIYEYKGGGYRACPLAWWSWRDIWAYIVYQNLTYLRSYDNEFNLGKNLSRTSVHIGSGRGANFGRFERLKKMNPEYFEIVKEQIHGA